LEIVQELGDVRPFFRTEKPVGRSERYHQCHGEGQGGSGYYITPLLDVSSRESDEKTWQLSVFSWDFVGLIWVNPIMTGVIKILTGLLSGIM
jgi:hypothetical protein